MPRKRKMDAIVAVDFGSTGTRGFATDGQQTIGFFFDPEVVRTDASVKEETVIMGDAPETHLWVAVGDRCYAVGQLAKHGYHACAGLAELKSERATVKAKAAIDVAVRKLNLSQRCTIGLSVLLPVGEMADSERLYEELQAATEFETSAGKYRLNLAGFNSFPEGMGLALTRQEDVKEGAVALVSLGYRNASIVPIINGAKQVGQTSELGFVRVVEALQQTVSGLDRDLLLKAIANSKKTHTRHVLGEDKTTHHIDTSAFEMAVRTRDPERRQKDVEQLYRAYKNAKAQHARTLIDWLDNHLPRGCQTLLLSGGTAEELRPELSERYKNLTVLWHSKALPPQDLCGDIHPTRMADSYELLQYSIARWGKRLKNDVNLQAAS